MSLDFQIMSPPIKRPTRLGYFGGTFDPVHNGHYEVACSAVEKLNLDVLFVVPTNPGYKDSLMFSYEHRTRMVEAAFAGHERISVTDWEKEQESAYTVDTLSQVKESFDRMFPEQDNEWFLIMGSDAAESLPSWKNWEQLFELATLVEVRRDSGQLSSTKLRDLLLAGEFHDAMQMMPGGSDFVLEHILRGEK